MTNSDNTLEITSPLQAIHYLRQSKYNPELQNELTDSALEYLDNYFAQDRLALTSSDKQRIAEYLFSLSTNQESI
jgi:hypothetical protein